MTDELPHSEPMGSPAPAFPAPGPVAVQAAVPAALQAPVPDQVPLRKPGKGRWFALATLLVLSAVAVGGGVGFGILQVDRNPKKAVAAPTASPTPSASPGYGAHVDGDHFGPLSDMLLPVPSGYSLGPDDPGIGNDTTLTAAQYHAIFDKDIASLSSSDRQKLEGSFNASFIKGDAVRTYQTNDNLVVEVELRQENQKVASYGAAWLKSLADSTQAFRAGPAVPGFPKVHCYLPPLSNGDKLDYLDCDASVGDLYVRLSAYGVAPLDSASATELLRQQLERLAIPGAQT
ncbi:hypothetical protein [Streptacidiphilus carbonis]|uniref:hypothetical protein n=1 Tax=Streptacidiphilus carbonis TaxID=105422 RepID=UPI0005A8D80E|nr:hypothetical protein [Streptacidiphilus carbonis]